LYDFEGGQLVGACLAVASVTETAILFGESRAAVSKVMSACMNHRKTSAKGSSGQKSTLMERDHHLTLRRIVVKTYKTAAAQVTAELDSLVS
jgi:hypothetical protein